LPCGDARQSKFSYLYLLHKNYQTRLKNSRKLKQIKLCCLLLIENKFEVKTQFECQITYKSNHMLLTLWNSNGDVSNWSIIRDKMFKIRSNFYYIIYKWWHEILTNLIIFKVHSHFVEFLNHFDTHNHNHVS
jgi:hypothetical protein